MPRKSHNVSEFPRLHELRLSLEAKVERLTKALSEEKQKLEAFETVSQVLKWAPGTDTHKSDSLTVRKSQFDDVLGSLLGAKPMPLSAVKTPGKRTPTPILKKKKKN